MLCNEVVPVSCLAGATQYVGGSMQVLWDRETQGEPNWARTAPGAPPPPEAAEAPAQVMLPKFLGL